MARGQRRGRGAELVLTETADSSGCCAGSPTLKAAKIKIEKRDDDVAAGAESN